MDILFNLLAKVIPYIFIGWIFTRLKFKNAELLINYFINYSAKIVF